MGALMGRMRWCCDRGGSGFGRGTDLMLWMRVLVGPTLLRLGEAMLVSCLPWGRPWSW